MAQTTAVEGAAVSKTRSMIKSPGEKSLVLCIYCANMRERQKQGVPNRALNCAKSRAALVLAFECAKGGETQKDFRQRLIEHCQEEEVLDFLFDFMKNLCVKNHMI